MRIMIAGAGEVGTHLAKLLMREEQDIVLVDEDVDRLRKFDSLNIMTCQGNPTCIDFLKNAGIKGTDLFVAVMPNESRNLTACIIASNLGAKHTFARIENNEYLLPANRLFFEKLGVNSMVYPERLAAKEILDSLNRTWVRDWWEAAGGELLMVALRVRKNAVGLIDVPLYELTLGQSYFHVTAINRDCQTIIPGGRDTIQSGDLVYFMTLPDHLEDLKRLCGKTEVHVRKVMIVGGSRIGLMTILADPDRKYRLLDREEDRIEQLFSPLENVQAFCADGRRMEELEGAGIQGVDAFVALTGSSEANILACLTAKQYGIKKTIAEVEDSDFIHIADKMDIGLIINKKLIAAGQIYNLLLKRNVMNMKVLKYSDAEVAEMVAQLGSKVTKNPVKSLNLPKEMLFGGLIRGGRGMLVNGDTQVQPNDTVIVFFFGTAISKIEKYFN